MSVLKRVSKAFMQGPIYVILFGLIFFGIGAGLSYRQFMLARDGGTAEGSVTNLVTRCDEDGCSYAPIVRFKTQNGESITFESVYSSSPPAYDVGEKVTVLYPFDAPEKADIKGGGKLFRIIFMSIGGVIMISGFGFFLSSAREVFMSRNNVLTPMDESDI